MKLTKREQKLIKRYDKPETVVLVSSYPDQGGESAVRNAIANYSRELLSEMSKVTRVVVLAEILDKPKIYEENGVLVVRCYKRDSLILVWQIVSMLRQFDKAEQVLTQFEFGVYGGSMVTFSLSLLGFLVRGMGKQYTVMIHQVTDDLGELSEHLGIASKGLKTSIYNSGMKLFYRLAGVGANRMLVHNLYLKNKLAKYVNSEKIGIVSHGVSRFGKINRDVARKEMGIGKNEQVLLVFGYLSWYKGSDWIVKQMRKLQKKYPKQKLRLILAGGESGTLKEMPHYQRYVRKLRKQADKSKIVITEYVADQDKAKYFSASDLVILPHRVAMSESGVMAHVMAYGKPYLLSMARVTSLDLDKSAPQVFDLFKPREFEKKMFVMLSDVSLRENVQKEIIRIGNERSWSKVVWQYLAELPGEQELAYTGARYAEVVV